MKSLKVILIVLASILLVTTSSLALTMTEDFSTAIINKADLTTSSGLNQWNDLVRWQISPTGGNINEWAQHTPNDTNSNENSLLFYGFDATGLGAGSAFSLGFDFINGGGSSTGQVYLGGLVGGEKISRFAPWADLNSTFFANSAINNNVNDWTTFMLDGLIDDDYDVLYLAFNMGGTTGLRGIDNVNLQVGAAPVPEPSTILLLSSGLLGLGWYGRKRKKT